MQALVDAGVREATVSPGSRSAPLALALEAHPDVRTTVLVDERSAGFFALGAAKASGLPVVACTTSGTAVANLLPAAVEADHAGARLVLLTADRPVELRGTGANQTIHQPGLFGAFVRVGWDLPHPHADAAGVEDAADWVARALAAAAGPPAGPVHLNAPFREPLAPTAQERRLLASLARRAHRKLVAASSPPTLPVRPEEVAAVGALVRSAPAGAIVAGPRAADDGLAPALRNLAARLHVPLLADPLSGLRYGDGKDAAGAAGVVVAAYDAFLSSPAVRARLAPAWVLQVGASPTSKHLRAWLADHAAAPRVQVDEDGRGWNDVPGDVRFATAHASAFVAALAQTVAERRAADGWLARWRRVEQAARARLTAAVAGRGAGLEAAVLPAVVGALGRHEALFVGNSLPVRDLDRFVPAHPCLRVFANRGASGIDGLVSTAAGVARVRGPTVAVVGDLSFQHDLGGLAALRAVRGDLRAVVVDNGGGQVFRHLAVAEAPGFERLFVAPQGLDVGAAAAAFGLRHADATPATVGAALRDGDADVVTVRVDGPASVAHRRAAAQAVADEALRLLGEAPRAGRAQRS